MAASTRLRQGLCNGRWRMSEDELCDDGVAADMQPAWTRVRGLKRAVPWNIVGGLK